MKNKAQGFSLVELVIATAIFMLLAGSLSSAATGTHLTRLDNARRVRANAYFTEGWEALRSIRDNDWSVLSDGTYGLSVSGGTWVLSGSQDTYEGMTRSVTISDVERDLLGNIVSSGGQTDDDSKKIYLEVDWDNPSGQTLSLHAETYLTNFKAPSVWPPGPPL